MKKVILSVFLLTVMLVTTVSGYAAYNLDDYAFEGGIGRVVMNNGTPTVDGNITDSEGYGAPVNVNYKNSTTIWAAQSRCIVDIVVRYAWDNSGIYVAADITDPSMIPTTGLDELTIEMDPGDTYGWNGDVFIFGIDPADAFYNAGFSTSADFSTWYCVSVDETGAFKCYRTQNDLGDITSDVTGSAALTNGGWKFEMMIPWDLLCEDVLSVSLGDVSVDADEITSLGTISHTMVLYMDRAYFTGDFTVFSNESFAEGDLFVLSRNVTIPTTLRDGTDGWKNPGAAIRNYGIELAAGDAAGNAPETTPPESDTETETTASAPESTANTADNTSADTTKASETTAADNDTSNTEEGGINVGLIIGIVAAVVVVIAIVVVVVIKKKKA